MRIDVGFSNVDLADSILVGWSSRERQLDVHLEVSLLPSHPNATAQPPGDRSCFRTATLVFTGVDDLRGLVAPCSDSRCEDYDTLHCLRTDGEGRYYLEGDLGEVYFRSDEPRLHFNKTLEAQEPRFVG